MELQDLKSGWQNAGGTFKSEADLLKMTKIMNHPSLKSIRIKLIFETIMLTFFLIIYYDWFDGDKKPLYANLLLVAGVILYISNDVIGYVSIANPIIGLDLKTSVNAYLARVKRLSVFSLIFSCLYSVCLISFFASIIHFTKEKSFLLLGIIIVLVQMMLWSRRIWTKWIKGLKQQVQDLNYDNDK